MNLLQSNRILVEYDVLRTASLEVSELLSNAAHRLLTIAKDLCHRKCARAKSLIDLFSWDACGGLYYSPTMARSILKKMKSLCSADEKELYIEILKRAFGEIDFHRSNGVEREWMYSFARVLVLEREDVPVFRFKQNNLFRMKFPDPEIFLEKYLIDLSENLVEERSNFDLINKRNSFAVEEAATKDLTKFVKLIPRFALFIFCLILGKTANSKAHSFKFEKKSKMVMKRNSNCFSILTPASRSAINFRTCGNDDVSYLNGMKQDLKILKIQTV